MLLGTARQKRVTVDGKRTRLRVLDLDAALERVRSNLVLAALAHGPASRPELLATTGLSLDLLTRSLGALEEKAQVRMRPGSAEAFELVGPTPT